MLWDLFIEDATCKQKSWMCCLLTVAWLFVTYRWVENVFVMKRKVAALINIDFDLYKKHYSKLIVNAVRSFEWGHYCVMFTNLHKNVSIRLGCVVCWLWRGWATGEVWLCVIYRNWKKFLVLLQVNRVDVGSSIMHLF
jgi:hypothetical protein